MVEATRNGGATWEMLAHSQLPPELDDSGGAWKCGRFNLSAFAGEMVQLRFTFDSLNGALNAFDGFFVDDIRVTGAGGVLFSDGFESGDLSAWTVVNPAPRQAASEADLARMGVPVGAYLPPTR